MCGFGGFIDTTANGFPKPKRAEILSAIGGQLERRGPDDRQLYDDGTLAFVFQRLAIIDVAGGRQPIWNEDRTLFAAVNGEIYNHRDLRASLDGRHRFATHSDSEVVLHLFEEEGPGALDRLIGIFAIAIWDRLDRRLFLARDRLGVKPLYYAHVGSGLIFGSELKALLVHPDCPRDLRWEDVRLALSDRLLFPSVPTFVDGVEHLPGGHWATFSGGRLHRQRYWSIETFFPGLEEAGETTPAGQVDRYTELFVDSVERQLMSDVPLGLFLSGGVDSSLIAAVASKTTRHVHCFYALERSTALSGDFGAAASLATTLGLPFHGVLFDAESLAAELGFGLASFEYFVWLLDSPRFDLEWFLKHELHRFAKTAVPDLKVMLLGQGGDEFAGGYSNAYANSYGWNEGESRWEAYLSEVAGQDHFELITRAGLDAMPASLLSDRFVREPPSAAAFRSEMSRRTRTLQAYNLWHEDRTAAGQGVEARVPFLDHRLCELLASIPASQHAELFWDKAIVRRVAARLLPSEFTSRPKVGFFRVRDMSSIETLTRNLIERTFPEFREKYLGSSTSLFAADALVRLYRRLPARGTSASRAADVLVRCMAIEVFADLCRTLGAGRAVSSIDPPSPLRPIDVRHHPWEGSVDCDDTPPFSDEQRVALEAAVDVCLPMRSGDGCAEVLFLREGTVEEAIEIAADMVWAIELLRLLSAREETRRIGGLASILGVPLSELQDTLRVFHARAWIVVD